MKRRINIKRLLRAAGLISAMIGLTALAYHADKQRFIEQTSTDHLESEKVHEIVPDDTDILSENTDILLDDTDILSKNNDIPLEIETITPNVNGQSKEDPAPIDPIEEFKEQGMKMPEGFTYEEMMELAEISVQPPKEYSLLEALEVLKVRAESDDRYTAIVQEKEQYPENILINLANNPEMLYFVSDFWKNAQPILMQSELEEKCPLFLQWDRRWGNLPYGDESTIAVSGCGPTALSMVVVGLTRDDTATPAAIADYAMENNYFMYGTGTMWSLMTEGAAHFGLSSAQIDVDEKVFDQYLSNQGMVICSVGRGDFTLAGHFIVIYDKDEEGYMINDPFCIYRSNQKWTFKELKKQMKSAWGLTQE